MKLSRYRDIDDKWMSAYYVLYGDDIVSLIIVVGEVGNYFRLAGLTIVDHFI